MPPTPGTGSLPEAYGTRELVLSPRNPNWIYAHWDFTREQLRDYNTCAKAGHLSLRVCEEGASTQEIKVHPESRNWFLRVPTPGAQYKAELGYYPKDGGPWVAISTSNVVTTPGWGLSEDTSAQFQTLTADLPFALLVRLARSTLSQTGPLPELAQKVRATALPGVPYPLAQAPGALTPEQESALQELVSMDEWRRTWMGSFELVEELKRKAAREGLLPGELWSGGVTSPSPVEEKKSFWFNVNAELIVYGATEPEARVAIGGRPIKLRPDGSFSFRFALPDGDYALPVAATSANGQESRRAALRFSRKTEYQGKVGSHPQAPELGTPTLDTVA